MVEQRTENPCVPGSIPGGTTSKKIKSLVNQLFARFFCFYALIEKKKIVNTQFFIMSNKKNIMPIYIILPFIISLLLLLYDVFIQKKIFVSTGIVFFILSYLCILGLLILFYKKKNTLLLKSITVFSAIFIIFFVFEIALRIKHEGFWWRKHYFFQHISFHKTPYHIRNPHEVFVMETEEFRYERKTNSLGLSDAEPKTKENENDFLIMALGDSFTEGDGAHADSTWVKFLEKHMKNNISKNYLFINAGVCGSDPVFEYRLFQDKLLHYKPDMLILVLGFEMEDIIIRGGLERFNAKGKVKFARTRYSEFIYALSYVYRLILHNTYKYEHLFMNENEFVVQRKNALEIIKNTLIKFKSSASENNLDLLLVFYPSTHEVLNNKYSYNDEIIKFARKNEIKTLDLLDYYVNKEQLNKHNVYEYYWEKNGHHNAKGYQLMGKAIYESILTKFTQENKANTSSTFDSKNATVSD